MVRSVSEDSNANKAERENVPVWNKFPELHDSVHEHTEFLTGGGVIKPSMPFAELEKQALMCYGLANVYGRASTVTAWRAGEALHAVFVYFSDRKDAIRESNGKQKLKDEPLTWCRWQDAKHVKRNTASRYIHVFKTRKLEDLAGKHLADLYGKDDPLYMSDPQPLGAILRAETKGFELYVNSQNATQFPVGSCVKIVNLDDLSLPRVEILTGKQKGQVAQMPLSKFAGMVPIAASEVKEPPPKPKQPKGSKSASVKTTAGIKPPPQPKVVPPQSLHGDGVYALTKAFKLDEHSTLLKGVFLGMGHDRGKGEWTFRILSGPQAGGTFPHSGEAIRTCLETISPESVANSWSRTMSIPPDFFHEEVNMALALLTQAHDAVAKTKKFTPLESAFLRAFKMRVKDGI